MKKIMNDPNNFVKEVVSGYCKAHSDVKMLDDDFRVLLRSTKADKVAVVTAGGSGHLPVFMGYVGEGMLDGCAIGDVFASPSSSKMLNMIKACDSGKGVLCLYGNYGGDKLNFGLAREEAEFEDILVEEVLVSDDVFSSDEAAKRRGVAGMVFAFKVAGAAAELGYCLEGVTTVAKKALDNLKTVGFATAPCIVPTVGKPTFTVEEGKIEIGMGIHGEAGIDVIDFCSADEIVKILFAKLNEELNLQKDDEVCLMVNGLGASPLEEQYIVYNKLFDTLTELGVKVLFPHIGEYATSMEMSGMSVSILKLDGELKQMMEYKAKTPLYTNFNK